MNHNFACMFEVVEQKNNKIQTQKQFFYEKQNEEGDLKEITKDEYNTIEANREAAEAAQDEIEVKEKEVSMGLKEVMLDKRQRSFIGLIENADGSITPAGKKNAWPDFIPEEAIGRIEQEAKQVEQITNNELELIEEEGSARKPKPKYEDE